MTEWRCFHCDQVFTVIGEAQAHFGISEMDGPACQVTDQELRRMEAELDAYRTDDTELHRTINGLKSDIVQATRDAEEKGYAKALLDIEAGRVEREHRNRLLAGLESSLRDTTLDLLAHLAGAVSILRRHRKEGSQELRDYEAALARGRGALSGDPSNATLAGSKGEST